jgi:membrane-bound inhibitor of C-type lysozyme
MRPLVSAFALIALASPAFADTGVNLGLSLSGDAEIKIVTYTCEGHDPITVQYVNAAPNFLAVMPIDGHQTVFVNVVTGSGAKYVSGQYEWWNKGTDATLHDVTEGLDAAPVLMCSEDIQTP